MLTGQGYIAFNLPSDAQTLLNNIASGDRWIFKLAKAAPQTGSGEAGQVIASAVEGTGQTNNEVKIGSGEFGEVNVAGIESTGATIVIRKTGSGEFGGVFVAGKEGSVDLPASTGMGEFASVTTAGKEGVGRGKAASISGRGSLVLLILWGLKAAEQAHIVLQDLLNCGS